MLKIYALPESLIRYGKNEGFELTQDQAEIVIGYHDGSDYDIWFDEGSKLWREDRQTGASDDWSVKEAIDYAIKQCQELIDSEENALWIDQNYLHGLKEDLELLETIQEV